MIILSSYRLLHSCHDDASRFIYLLAKPGCNFLEQEDFIPLLQVHIFSTLSRSEHFIDNVFLSCSVSACLIRT